LPTVATLHVDTFPKPVPKNDYSSGSIPRRRGVKVKHRVVGMHGHDRIKVVLRRAAS
jgi:hypothetical protein